MAATRKKYVDLAACYIFEPITAVQTLSIFNASAHHLLDELGRRDSLNCGEASERLHTIPEDLGTGAALQCCPIT